MPRLKTYTLTGFAVSADGVALAQAPSAGVALTLEAGAANLSPPRELLFDADGAMAAVNFTVVGLDRQGNPQTEVVTGVTTTAVSSVKIYSSVTSITPDATDADNVTVGWDARTVSPWVVCGIRRGYDTLSVALVSFLILTGAADGIVEVTYDSPAEPEPAVDETLAITPGTPVEAQGVMCRVVLTSGANTSAEARIAQPGP
jgi:hypothetical protein